MNLIFTIAMSILVLGTQSACASTADVKQIVESKFQPLTDRNQPKEKRYQSILIGVVTPFETQIIPLGTLTDKGEAPTATTIFEIGSITKGFVGLILANEKVKGGLDLDQPYNLKSALNLPNYNGKEITWRHLSQHTAGFPRVPDNLKPSDPLQPYLDYDLQKLNSFLSGFKLQEPPGTKSDYSNLGAGLAGYGLEQIYKKSLEKLFQASFLDKLSMNDTRVMLSAEQLGRLTPVFLNGDQVQPWQWKETSVLQGAGALRSTMQDMMTLLKTMMGLATQDSLPMTTFATKPTFNKGTNSELGLFWNHLKAENITWHNGGTYGSSSFFGYDPDRLVGIVVLSNSNIIDDNGVDSRLDIASIEALLKIAASLKMDKPIKTLKDYDIETARRISEFEKTPVNPKDKSWVALKMAHMFDIDQYMRNLFMKVSDQGFNDQEKEFFQKAYSRRFYMMDWQNTQDLKQLLKIHGWFKISEWGKQLDKQAWLLVQHADNEPEFQKEVLKILSALYKIKETDPSNYAYLYDRVASSFSDPGKRKPQRYGTQGSCVGPGKWEPLPIEDAGNVDKRRAEVGLPPLQEYIDVFKDICK
jgi:D-alanyl-D-alanine-carboxypeptidase/D-alanyl-D-alanine-endopeptidase